MFLGLNELRDNIEVRLALASLLFEESRVEEAISVLSPPDTNGKSSEPDMFPSSFFSSFRGLLVVSFI